jgi:hypothetical protein
MCFQIYSFLKPRNNPVFLFFHYISEIGIMEAIETQVKTAIDIKAIPGAVLVASNASGASFESATESDTLTM